MKDRSNSIRIKSLGRVARRRTFRKRGKGLWSYDKPALPYLLIEVKNKITYHQVMSSLITALKIISKQVKNSLTIYTDSFNSYIDLGETGYKHEYVNYSDSEWHINNCENRASILRL